VWGGERGEGALKYFLLICAKDELNGYISLFFGFLGVSPLSV